MCPYPARLHTHRCCHVASSFIWCTSCVLFLIFIVRKTSQVVICLNFVQVLEGLWLLPEMCSWTGARGKTFTETWPAQLRVPLFLRGEVPKRGTRYSAWWRQQWGDHRFWQQFWWSRREWWSSSCMTALHRASQCWPTCTCAAGCGAHWGSWCSHSHAADSSSVMEATAHCLPSAVILQVLLVAVVNVVCQYSIGDF